METYNLNKKIYGKVSYENVINTSITQLQNPPSPQSNTITIEEFFSFYQTLFYEIPKEGEINSHRFLVEQSGQYIGDTQITSDVQALLDEITSLRQNLLAANQQLLDIQMSSSTI
jgi:hypothetical protein